MGIRKTPASEELYNEYLRLKKSLLENGKTRGAVIALARKYDCSSDTIRYHILKYTKNIYYKVEDWTEDWPAEWEDARQKLLRPKTKNNELHETITIPASDIPRGFIY